MSHLTITCFKEESVLTRMLRDMGVVVGESELGCGYREMVFLEGLDEESVFFKAMDFLSAHGVWVTVPDVRVRVYNEVGDWMEFRGYSNWNDERCPQLEAAVSKALRQSRRKARRA